MTSLTEDRQRRTDHRFSVASAGSQYPSNQQWEQQLPASTGNNFHRVTNSDSFPVGTTDDAAVQIDTGIGAALAVPCHGSSGASCVVAWIGGFFGFPWGWILVAVWILSGAVTFLRPAENHCSVLLRLRLADPDRAAATRARLGTSWLSGLASIPDRFTLWIQESDDANATPTPGHTVAVTAGPLHPSRHQHLEAVLAHELEPPSGRACMAEPAELLVFDSGPRRVDRRPSARQVDGMCPALGCAVGAFLILGYVGLGRGLIFGNGWSSGRSCS